MEKSLKVIEKPFGRLGRTEGDPGGTDPERSVLSRDPSLTAASYASFIDGRIDGYVEFDYRHLFLDDSDSPESIPKARLPGLSSHYPL